ncbi:MAG TPA: DegV family protein [Leptolinea sp.]
MTVHIVTDSCCDLPDEIVKELNIEVVPLFVNLEGVGYRDGIDIDRREFYQRLPILKDLPKSSSPSPEAFKSVFNQLADEGAEEILVITITKVLSETIGWAQNAAQNFKRTAIQVIDSHNLSLAQGLIVRSAAQAAQAGMKLVELVSLVEDIRSRTFSVALFDDLRYGIKGGRVTKAQGWMASVLDIRPVIGVFNDKILMERVRTRQRAISYMSEVLNKYAPVDEVAFMHSFAADNILAEARAIAARVVPAGKTMLENVLTPIMGTHVGPGSVGFAAITKVTVP